MVALLLFLGVTLFFGITSGPEPQGNWTYSLNNSSGTYRMGLYVDQDGTFYTAAGKDLYAIDSDGSTKWKLMVDSKWLENYSRIYLRQADYKDSVLYAIIAPDPNNEWSEKGLLIAVSESGEQQWQVPIDDVYRTDMMVSENRVYLYEEGVVLAYDLHGRLQWSTGNLYYAPAVGSDGVIFLINSSDPYDSTKPWSGSLSAYYTNGSLFWSHELSDYTEGGHMYLCDPGLKVIQYRNGMIYIAQCDRLTAISEDGIRQWEAKYQGSLGFMGFDDDGKTFLISNDYQNNSAYSTIIAPDGKEKKSRLEGVRPINTSLQAREGNVAYFVTSEQPQYPRDPRRLDNYTVGAYDLNNGELLWSNTITATHVQTITLNSSNVGRVLAWGDLSDTIWINGIDPKFWYMSKNMSFGTHDIKGQVITDIATSQDMVYFSYWAYSYEYPAFYGMANCTYAGGIYALDKQGRLIWYKDTDSYVTSMTARNGTVYYQINGGKFSAAGTGMAAGIAAAAVYLFFRIFMMGAVSRARARLDQNDNRNSVLRFVAENPGATLYEIGRALGLNVGTARYHLLILTINHKLTVSKTGAKSVGYFASGRRYSGEEKLVMSMLRREHMKNLLENLIERPGLSNMEMARGLSLPDSSVSRNMTELYDKGIVTKRRSNSGKLAYFIADDFRPVVSALLADGCAQKQQELS